MNPNAPAVSEAMVEAALDTYWEGCVWRGDYCEDFYRKEMRTTLEAALRTAAPAPPAGDVRREALEDLRDKLAWGASDVAEARYPGGDQQLLRTAYCDGAASLAPAIAELERLRALIKHPPAASQDGGGEHPRASHIVNPARTSDGPSAETPQADRGEVLHGAVEEVRERPAWMTKRHVSHVEAKQIAKRFIDGHFRNSEHEYPRTGIPARPDRDDDLLLHAYIWQQERDQSSSIRDALERTRVAEAERDAERQARLKVQINAVAKCRRLGVEIYNAKNHVERAEAQVEALTRELQEARARVAELEVALRPVVCPIRISVRDSEYVDTIATLLPQEPARD